MTVVQSYCGRKKSQLILCVTGYGNALYLLAHNELFWLTLETFYPTSPQLRFSPEPRKHFQAAKALFRRGQDEQVGHLFYYDWIKFDHVPH